MNRQSTEDFFGSELLCMILQQWIYVIVSLSKLTECATPRASPNASCGLLVIMMCQWRFISYNKWTTLVGDADNQRGYACIRMRRSWEISGPSSQFCLEPQTVLNSKIYYIKILRKKMDELRRHCFKWYKLVTKGKFYIFHLQEIYLLLNQIWVQLISTPGFLVFPNQ